MTTETDYQPIHVHVASSDVQLGGGKPKRCRRALKTNTFTLTALQPTQCVLPQSDSRVEAYITSATEATPPVIYIAPSQAGANGQGGGAAQIIGSDTTPVPVNTTDQVWVSAATGFPVTVSVWAIYEEYE